ncbi:MAG: hypothetical protein ACFB2W_09940 [Leptolyngbyaceae cyanobacterium]
MGNYYWITGAFLGAFPLAFLDADDIAHLAKSDFFGETALLVGEASLVTGIVEQDLSVLVFDHDEIATLMASSARFANQMNQFIEDRKTSIRLAQEIKSIQPLANYPIAIR